MNDALADAYSWYAVVAWVAETDRCASPVWCVECHRDMLAVDAASVALDHAIATDAAIRSVAW